MVITALSRTDLNIDDFEEYLEHRNSMEKMRRDYAKK